MIVNYVNLTPVVREVPVLQERPRPELLGFFFATLIKVADSSCVSCRRTVRNWHGGGTTMISNLTLSELEHCLRTVVGELREQYDLANRVHDVRFKRTKMLLLESSLSTYQWLAVERVRKRDHPLDAAKSPSDRR